MRIILIEMPVCRFDWKMCNFNVLEFPFLSNLVDKQIHSKTVKLHQFHQIGNRISVNIVLIVLIRSAKMGSNSDILTMFVKYKTIPT